MIRYLSVCSGIEAATQAWHPLGWEPAAFSEIEPFPRALLAHHYPHVPLHGDFTTINGNEYGTINLLVGGTPCQSFSIAGLRAGLDDPRGNLMLGFGALAKRTRAEWLVWENVPGVLSSNGGRDFGSFLGMLAELGYGFAYRVLDAQHFGVPQRRRRVFVVAHLGDWHGPAAVLFERESLSGNPAPRRSPGQGAAAGTLRRTDGGSDVDHARAGHLIAGTLTATYGDQSGQDLEKMAGGLQVQAFGGNNQTGAINLATACRAHGSAHLDFESETFLVQSVAAPVARSVERPRGDGLDTLIAFDSRQDCVSSTSLFGALGSSSPQAQAVCVTGDITHTLKAEGFDASEDGTGRGQPIVTAFSCKDYGNDAQRDLAPTMRAMGHNGSHANAGGQLAVQAGMAVRRLTPRECERLQGFPDVIDQLTITICKNEDEKIALAKYADLDSVARKHVQNAPVAAHVLIDYGQQLLQLRSAGKLILSASTAETQSASLLRMPPADFVQLIALTRPCLETGMQAGRVASPGSTSSSIAPSSGSAHVLLYGYEISELASDAEAFTDALLQCMKSITSHPGRNSQQCDSTLQTLSCCVAAAISGCIPEKMRSENFSLMVEVVTPYTLVPHRGKPAADGPRYKALGNSMAVPCMAWIGRRIQAVIDIQREAA